jgi:hypothetical protein
MKMCSVLTFLWLLDVNKSNAQDALSIGGEATGSGGAVSYSIGQIDYAFKGNTTFTLAEGVQQPYEISVTALDENNEGIMLSVYPNPVVNMLRISCHETIKITGYTLQDATGRMLHTERIYGSFYEVDMQRYPTGNYFITINTSENKSNHYLLIKK